MATYTLGVRSAISVSGAPGTSNVRIRTSTLNAFDKDLILCFLYAKGGDTSGLPSGFTRIVNTTNVKIGWIRYLASNAPSSYRCTDGDNDQGIFMQMITCFTETLDNTLIINGTVGGPVIAKTSALEIHTQATDT
jgi:hypothetical protein